MMNEHSSMIKTKWKPTKIVARLRSYSQLTWFIFTFGAARKNSRSGPEPKNPKPSTKRSKTQRPSRG
jgi:hypothetical protein